MPRASRNFPGELVCHVLNRGVGRRTLFEKDGFTTSRAGKIAEILPDPTGGVNKLTTSYTLDNDGNVTAVATPGINSPIPLVTSYVFNAVGPADRRRVAGRGTRWRVRQRLPYDTDVL